MLDRLIEWATPQNVGFTGAGLAGSVLVFFKAMQVFKKESANLVAEGAELDVYKRLQLELERLAKRNDEYENRISALEEEVSGLRRRHRVSQDHAIEIYLMASDDPLKFKAEIKERARLIFHSDLAAAPDDHRAARDYT